MSEFYGSSAVKDQFKAGTLPGQYFTLIDKETGEITVKRKGTVSGASSGLGLDALKETTIGTIDPKTKKFTSTEGGGTASENTFFNSAEGTNTARQSAQTVTTKAIAETGDISYQAATEQTQDLFSTNRSTDEEVSGDSAVADAEGGVGALATAANNDPAAKGTRKSFPGARGTEPLTFPEGIGFTQRDVIKFNMLEYVPRGLTSAGGGGGNKFGPSERPKGRKIIGSIVLPIPAGIGDQSNVNWGPNSMNVGQMAAAGIAKELLGDSKEKGAIDSTIDALSSNNEDVKEAIRNALAGAATGSNPNALLGRTTGNILNPNMELLFSSPALRPFNFNFLLSPRNRFESQMIVKIIRFFKQGMAPIRSESNLFLKSPHTFQMQYLRRGGEDHKFLNRFKECALQSLGVNYTPNNNYSVYEDGSMQAYQMNMTFTELTPVFNDEFPDDGDTSVGF
tara:strand:+ start:1832 stop:3187 length:1356 start_codon:yes stop_codon:yes gene_type:complete